jgi:hypothetical protein
LLGVLVVGGAVAVGKTVVLPAGPPALTAALLAVKEWLAAQERGGQGPA